VLFIIGMLVTVNCYE